MLLVQRDGLDDLGLLGQVRGDRIFGAPEYERSNAPAERLCADEHETVREVAVAIQERMAQQTDAGIRKRRFTTIEKMFALGAAPMFSRLSIEGLADLAQASVDAEYAPGQTLYEEGEPGNEVCILLAGEVVFLQGQGANERVIGREGAGSLIGEMAVLDPAPRSATVRAGADGMHVLRLNGEAFRDVLNANPAIASGIIRTLAQRLRGVARVQQAVNVA